MAFRIRHIATRFALILAIAAVLPLVAYGVVSILSLRNGTRQTVITGNLNVATRAADEISRYVSGNADILKALAEIIMARKEELYELSFDTGATRNDGWIDIEGGAGTFFAFSSKGRRELPDDTIVIEGAGTFAAQPTKAGDVWMVGKKVNVALTGPMTLLVAS